MRSVFPATTPTALTTLATGVWPGQHGIPGWELRDQKLCEYPGEPVNPVQIRVLHKDLWDLRTNQPLRDFGFAEDDVFFAKSWSAQGQAALSSGAPLGLPVPTRHMLFVSAYVGTGFTNFAQGKFNSACERCVSLDAKFALALIGETAVETLRQPEGPKMAGEHFQKGVDTVLENLKKVGQEATYSCLYTAHPDKHMHELGVEHASICEIVRQFDLEIQRLWTELQKLEGKVALFVTADHGHVTVGVDELVVIPKEVEETLEYACVGATGKGRHAYLRVRSGLGKRFEAAWFASQELYDNFILLLADVAVDEDLFGPGVDCEMGNSGKVDFRMRPRLGDYVAISLNSHTLCSPCEKEKLQSLRQPCVGAHGSISPQEVQIPFVLLRN